MKKYLLFAIFISLFATANAQIGVMAGANLATFNEPSGDYTYLPGPNAFLLFEKGLIPILHFRADLGYIQKGTAGTVLGIDYVTKLNYLQLNFNAKIKPPLIPVYAFAGPYLSYGLNGYYKAGSVSVDVKFDDNNYNRFDAGLNLGIGLQRKLPVGKLFIEGGYSLGMMNIDNSGLTDYTKNSGLYIDLGFML